MAGARRSSYLVGKAATCQMFWLLLRSHVRGVTIRNGRRKTGKADKQKSLQPFWLQGFSWCAVQDSNCGILVFYNFFDRIMTIWIQNLGKSCQSVALVFLGLNG